MEKIASLITFIYKKIFLRKRFYGLNKLLFTLSLNGLGILNFKNGEESGEDYFINWLVSNKLDSRGIIMDVGANRGDYARNLRRHKSEAKVYCFEPHPVNFEELENLSSALNFTPLMKGMGEKTGNFKIYDYESNNGSQHASMFKGVIEDIHKSKSTEIEIDIITIDEFVSQNKIMSISLLKIDTEGNELNVLKGARDSINRISIIHLEFNEMNIISKTYFKDIIKELPGFKFFRLLPDGMVDMGDYNPVFFEIFAFQNIIAVNNNLLRSGETLTL